MDFSSIFIASVIVAFFASNYFVKHKEEKIKEDYIGLFVYIGFILEVLVVLGIAMRNFWVMYVPSIIISILIFIQLYLGIRKINYYNKNKREMTNFECSILGVRNIFYILGALILVPQHIVYLICTKIFK